MLVLPCQAATKLKVQDEIGYFVSDGQSTIERYDFATASWLTPIVLVSAPTAYAVSPSKIFVAYGRRLEQMNRDGSDKTFLNNAATDVIDLMLDGDVLFANRSNGLYAYFTSYNALNGAPINDVNNYPHSAIGSSICTATNKMFGRSSGVSPSDIVSVSYNDAGQLLSIVDSNYHGDYPDASRTWCFPNGLKVLDNSGTVYTTADMRYAASLGNSILSVGFVGSDTPIALTSGKLVSYSNAIVETGRFTLANANANTVYVHNNYVYAFYPSGTPSGLAVEIVPTSALNVGPPNLPISPVGLNYSYDQIVSDGVSNLYILSGIHNSIFRWNAESQKYLPTISLPEQGTRIAYNKLSNQLYVATANQRIYRVNLDAAQPTVLAFTQTPQTVNFLLPMRMDLLVAQNGTWNNNWIYGADGALLNSNIFCCYNNFAYFDQARNLLYFEGRRSTYLGGGVFSNQNEVNYGGLRFVGYSPDSLYAADTQGSVVNLDTAQVLGYLANGISHAGWPSGGTLISLANNSVLVGYRRLQRWANNFDLATETLVAGTNHDLHILGPKAVVAAQLNGAPNFTVFDGTLNVLSPTPWEAPTLSLVRFSAVAADFSWPTIQGEQEVLLERSSLSNPTWQAAGTALRDRLTISSALSGPDLYQFRIRAANNGTYTPYSNVVEVDTRPIPVTTVDPRVTVFVPDDAFISEEGNLYLLSSINHSIFVWNIARQDWQQTIPLRGNALFMTYMPKHKAIFTSYLDGRMYGISLSGWSAELAFGEGPLDGSCGLIATDDILMACDYYGAWESNSAFSLSGLLLDTKEWRYQFNGGVWSPVKRRVYHLRDGTSPNDLIAFTVAENGTIGNQVDSPYHTSTGIGHPVRVSPAGDVVILGPGQVFDADTLQYAGNLPRPMTDAVWMGSRLFTSNNARIDAHEAGTYALAPLTRTLSRPILRLFAQTNGKFVVILSRADGGTAVQVLDDGLQDVEKPILLDGFE